MNTDKPGKIRKPEIVPDFTASPASKRTRTTRAGNADRLLRRAERLARKKTAPIPENPADLTPEAAHRTLHELQVHQIELEMQNEELRRAQGELEASRARYFEFYDLAPVGLLSVSEAGFILEANLTAAGLLGVARSALVNRKICRFIFPEDQDRYRQHRQQLWETGARQVYELRLLRANTTHFWARLEATAARDAGGARVCRAVVSDITEPRQAEAALRQSETRYREVVDNLNEGLWLLDQEARTTFVNSCLAEMLGYTPEEMMGRTLFSFMDAAGVGRGRELLGRRPQQTPEIQDLEFRRKDGQPIHTRLTTAPILDEQGRYAGAVAGVLDVTERVALERAVRDISEREQRRIGEDLHDGLGQMLTAIELSCSSLQQDLPSDLPELQNQAAQMGELLREAIRQTRMLALGLTGFRLTSHGLCAALTELAQSISSLGRLRCRFDCPEPVSFHDPVIDVHLYRIAQEAVHNAVKHAQGSQVRICLTQAAGALRLQVSDDGTGLPGRSESPNPGMGLQVMRHRASIIGAHLSVESSPGQGVTVTCMCRRGDAETGSQTRDPSNEP